MDIQGLFGRLMKLLFYGRLKHANAEEVDASASDVGQIGTSDGNYKYSSLTFP